MHTKDLPLYYCTKRKQVEKFIQHLPSLHTHLSLTFIVKTKETIYTCNLVITPKEENVLREFYLVSKQKNNAFEGH
jgi:hypothetical protein